MASKGKAVADGKGKRKRDDSDKTGRRRRKNSGVLQFFEDSAFEIDESDSSMDSLFGDDDDDFLEDEIDTQVKVKSEPGKTGHLPFLPKEEEMTEEEIDKMLEERYKPGSNFVSYAEDRFDTKRSVDRSTMTPSYKDPIIWKVKCMVGRERHSAFCLMQKYVDLQSLGTKLQIISAFALEHVKGAIYIEADKQSDVNEACSGLCSIYSTRVAPVPQNEVSHLFNVRSKSNSIAVGTWARVKNGKYKGDLAQVVVVNDLRKKATVKLIPRIDLQAMAAKFGGGVTSKKAATPAPRLICSSELEEFRPLIQYRRDRDTDTFFEILDGMMLKDGYLYKKVPIDSLSFWGVLPSEDELLKFEPSKNEESNDVEFLSQLYGEQKKKCTKKSDKGGGKGEGSSSSNMENGFEVHDMVFFSRTGFGVIIGREKDDSFKVLKDGSEGPVVVNVKLRELKKASFDKKFTTWDRHRKTISINDTLKILEGPLEGRQGIVKQIYRGTVFLYDEVEQENSGYCCSKAQNCEKIKLSSACKEKGGEPGPSGLDDFSSSPKSPLSPKKPWQEKDNNGNFNQGDKDGMFSVGQSLRIRVGPLKGYLCRVLALRRSDVMVKLDSQQKILTVKTEHLAAVRGKNLVVPIGNDSDSAKPFDLLGTQDGSRGWMDGAGTSTEAEGWTAGGQSTERSSWAAFPSSSFSLQPDSDSADPLNSMDIGSKKDVGGSAWETKVDSTQNLGWGAAVTDEKALVSNEQGGGWGKSDGGWNNATSDTVFGSSTSDSWGRAKVSNGDQPGSSNDAGSNWGTAKLKIASTSDSCDDMAPSWGKNNDSINNQDGGWKKSEGAWDKGNNITGDSTSSWGNANVKNQVDSWGKGKDGSSGSKAVWSTSTATPEKETGGWGDASGGGYNAGGGGRSGGRGGGRGGYGGRGGGGGNACYKCGETGHMARECSQGGGGNACYKCGETGHMARECSQGGGGGGNACFKCGETGHMARECSQGGGGGGNACYKCGEAGHMARECSQGGGGGNACYKCGETGHMARECSQGGGGGNACYKCGETGHIARECSQGGGSGGERYGRSSWSASISSNFSLHPESDSSNPLKSMDNDLNKDVGETAWASKVAPSQNSSWGAAKTEVVGGWGKSDGGWNRTSDTGFGSTTSDSWAGTKVSSGDQPGSSKDAGASWGKTSDATNNQVDGWKKSAEAWDKGNVTVNSTSSWGNANVKTQVDSWSKGKDGEDGFNGSKAAWSTSTTTLDKETGGWGNVSAGGRSGSRGGGRGGYSGRGGGGGNACFKCGETGHMARECSQGGGGNACYKCGETGHMARECSQGGGGGGGNACYKCGESGHMARECSQGGGNACYKCGETGHMARECSQGGGTGGNACYKCGETGHMARECSQGGGGRNSRSTWSSSSFLLQPESGSANPLKSTDNVFKKDVEDSAWATKVVSNHNSSWGAAMADDALGKTEEVGGWGKSVGGWNKTTSDTGVGSSTSDGWGRANVTGDGQYGSPKDAGANWGKAKVKSDSPTDTSNDAAPSWGKNNDLNTNQESGWKKSSEPWDKGSKVTGTPTSSWSGPSVENQVDSWGNAADKWINKENSSGSKGVLNTSRATTEKETGGWGNDTAPSWGKNDDAITNQDGGGWKKSNEAWDKGNNVTGNPTSSWSNPNVKNQEDSRGSAADKWNSKESSCRSKAVWNSSGATTEKEAGGWGNVSGGGWSDGRGGGQGGYGGRGGGGNACYKCGEAGHIARDCSQGGGRSGGCGGGNGCYKCGEQGHFARECPSSNS